MVVEHTREMTEPEEISEDPEEFGGTDDGLETLSMAYDNLKLMAERGRDATDAARNLVRSSGKDTDVPANG